MSHARDYFQMLRNRAPVIVLTFVVLFATAAVLTHLRPKQYLGRAAVEIVQNDDDLRVFGGAGQSPDALTLNFIATQFEIISSQQTLYRVIDEHDLVRKWDLPSRSAAYGAFRGKLEPSARRNTNLIDIEVYADSPAEAALLANAVADSYSYRRLEGERQRVENALGALDEQVEKQRTQVATLRLEMLRLMRENDIIDFAGARNSLGTSEPMTPTPSVLMNSEQRLYDLKREIASLSTQIEKFSKLSGDDLIKMAMSLDVADASVLRVYPQYLDQSIQLERLRNLGLGARHPKVLAIEQELLKMNEFLEGGVRTIRDTLTTQLQIARESLTRIEALHEDKKDQSMTEREDFVAYAEAKNEYDSQNVILQRMEANYHQAMVDQNMTSTPIIVHERAEPDSRPRRPNIPLSLALGAILAAGFSLGLALFLEYLDNGIKSIEHLETIMEAPVLAVVPQDTGLLAKTGTEVPDAEAYRILRTGVEMNRPEAGANILTVVSGSPGEGKSTTIANLATICADGGYNTLLIDADMRRPQMHQIFEKSNAAGLSTFLASERPLEQCVGRVESQENLWLMPSGQTPRDPSGLLNAPAMRQLLADVRTRFDIILIDSPPILGVSDSAVLVREADMTLAVVQHKKLAEKTLHRVRQAVEGAGGALLGSVMNNVDLSTDRQFQYYTNYYGYYDGRTAEPLTDLPSVELPPVTTTATTTATRKPLASLNAADAY